MNSFIIKLVQENGTELYYGYNGNFPYLTKETKNAYSFNTIYYPTKKHAMIEALRIKQCFFGSMNVSIVIVTK